MRIILLLSLFLLPSFTSAAVRITTWHSSFVPYDEDPPSPPADWLSRYGGQQVRNELCDYDRNCPPAYGVYRQRRVAACPTGMIVVGKDDEDWELCDFPDSCDDEWSTELGSPLCRMCPGGTVDAGEGYRFGPRCQAQQESEECLEIGEFYNPNGYCTTECSSGSAMNNICLLRDDDQEDRCGPDSDDFRGTIGHGGNTQSVCGDNSCPKGGSYGFEEGADGSYQATCFPPNTNPPECPAGSAVIMGSDKVSFQCESIRLPGPDDGNGDGKGDGSDGDSDGDGKADTDGMAGQLNDIKKLLGKGNTNTGNINETLKGLSNQLGEGVGKLTEAIGNIPGGGGGGNGGKTEIVGKDGEGIAWSGEAIEMEIKDGLEELEAAQAEYETLIGNIRSEMASSIGSFSGGGGLQDNNITLFGHTFNAGLSKFGADLSIVGSVVLFAATFMALGIVMGARD